MRRCQPINCAGLVGSACGQVGMGSPSEVWQEGETHIRCKMESRKHLKGKSCFLMPTDSRWIPRKGGHCRQHSRGCGPRRVRGGRVGRACRSWWRRSRPRPAALPATTTSGWRGARKGFLVSTGDQDYRWFTGEDCCLTSPRK